MFKGDLKKRILISRFSYKTFIINNNKMNKQNIIKIQIKKIKKENNS